MIDFGKRNIFHDSSIESRGYKGSYLYVDYNNRCNNRCRHCHIDDPLGAVFSHEDLSGIIADNRIDSLFIRGGEPTIEKSFLRFIFGMMKSSAHQIAVETNGRMLSYNRFCESLKAIDPDSRLFFIIKLFGPEAASHDAITNDDGSFAQTLQGIRNLKHSGQKFSVRIILSKQNYLLLHSIVELVRQIDESTMIEISIADPSCKEPQAFKEIVPSFSELKSSGFEEIIMQNAARITLDSLSIPLCLFPDLLELHSIVVNTNHNRDIHLSAGGAKQNPYELECQSSIKDDQCENCEYNCLCPGFPRRYVEEYGFNELQPAVWDTLEVDGCYHNLVKNGFDPGNPHPDVVALFSGGLDSSMAVSIYAEQNPDKKILLLSFLPSFVLYLDRARRISEHLMQIYPQVTGHLVLPVPAVIPRTLFLNEFKRNFTDMRYCEICLPCRLIWISMAVYLIRKQLKSECVLFGSVFDDFSFDRKNAEVSTNTYSSFIAEYSIRMEFPVLYHTKKQLFEKAGQLGFPGDILEGLNPATQNYVTQGFCILEYLKINGSTSRFLQEKGYQMIDNTEYTEYLRSLLKNHGVVPDHIAGQ